MTERLELTEVLHGVTVADPYRYMEDPQDPRTQAFVAAQNEVSTPYLEGLPGRDEFLASVTELLTSPRAGVPQPRGGRYLMWQNPGHLDQDRLLIADTLEQLLDDPDVLFDPQLWSADGTLALNSAMLSPNGEHVAYAVSSGGSDWITIRVRTVAELITVAGSADTADHALADDDRTLRWCKWSAPVWLPDSSGFLYWQYPEPEDGAELTDALGAGALKLHRLGAPATADTVVWSRPEEPEWMPDVHVAGDDSCLILSISPGTDSRCTLSLLDLVVGEDGLIAPQGPERTLIGELADAHHVVEAENGQLYLRTDRDAPRGRLVSLSLADPGAGFTELLAEHPQDVLVGVELLPDGFLTVRSRDAAHVVDLHDRAGLPLATLPLPEQVSITAVQHRYGGTEVFLGTASFTRRLDRFRLDLNLPDGGLTTLPAPGPSSDLGITATRIRVTSTDGAEVPMTVLSRPDRADGPASTLLYGYGGFDIPILPSFSALFAAWVQAGGVLAVANLRGGGEFGSAWHHQGMKQQKQQVFDDAIACAEGLIAAGITTSEQLAVHGRSNGGLLVGALMTQRPDLWAVALPSVGVLDMLRFHLFTIGWAWTSEYGSPDDAADFPALLEYSPLHRLAPGTRYPATLICTGDHDDRVVPAHSLKFGAELLHCQTGDAPVLLRVDTRAGHGAGKPISALALEYADVLAFTATHTGLT